nr:EOG090X08P9 [Sida crystallina]
MYVRKISKLSDKIKSMVVLGISGSLSFAGFNVWNCNEKFYSDYVMPLVQNLDPEMSHRLAVLAMKHCFFRKQLQPDPPTLTTEVWGRTFPNPIGMAAGFDKDGEAMQGLYRTGFGFVEIGSVTPQPQPGNPKPRVFRLTEDSAVINRYGFNSQGHAAVLERVKEEINRQDRGLIGVNLGKNKTSENAAEDYVAGVQQFGLLADYLVINVSSPNTPGLRSLQNKDELEKLISKVVEARNSLDRLPRPPLLLKIAPDLTDEEKKDIVDVISSEKCRIDGLIVSNTTVSRPEHLISRNCSETGGLSGQPLKDMSTQCVRDMYRLTQGRVPIIGVGGIASGQDAFEKFQAGASLVQLYTAMTLEGPPVVRRIKRELDDILRSHGYSNVAEARGRSA